MSVFPPQPALDEDRFDLTLLPWMDAAESIAALLDNRAGRLRLVGFDDFANHPEGAIAGLEPALGPAWETTGSSIASVSGGRAHSTGTSGGYVYQTFDPQPTLIGAAISFGGSGAGWPVGLVFTRDGTSGGANLTQHLLHLVVGPTGYTLTTRKDGGAFPVAATGLWDQPCLLDGTVYQIGLAYAGNLATIYGPNGEIITIPDPRISEALAGYDGSVYWQPIVASGTEGYIHRTYAFAGTDQGWAAASDFLSNLGGGGRNAGDRGRIVGSKNQAGQVSVGRQIGAVLPAITWGATEIRATLTASVSIGNTTFQSDQPIPPGATVVLGTGNDAETLTTSGYSTGSASPFTTTVTSGATKAHAAGASVVATSTQVATAAFQLATGLLAFDKGIWLQNQDLWLASDGSVRIGGSSNVASMGAGDSFSVDGNYNGGTLRVGSVRMWREGSNIRAKDGTPANATDGQIIWPMENRLVVAEQDLALFTGPSMLVTPLGDSTTAQSSGIASYYSTDWTTKLMSLSDGALVVWGWAATGGHRISQGLARIPTDVLALSPRPRYATVLIGINDVGDGASVAAIRAGLTSIYDALIAGGVCPIPITLTPRDSGPHDIIQQVNAWIIGNASAHGWPYVDIYSALVNPATGQYAAGYGADGVHPTTDGSTVIAQTVWDAVGHLFTSPPYLAGSAAAGASMNANGLFVGDSNADGLANGWVWNSNLGTVTPSLVAGTDGVLGNWQQIVVTGAGLRELIDQAQITTGWAVGDLIEFAGRYEVEPDTGMTFSIRLRAGRSVGGTTTVCQPVNGIAVATDDGVFRVRARVPADTTALYASITSNAGTGTWRVAQVTTTNLTALGLA